MNKFIYKKVRIGVDLITVMRYFKNIEYLKKWMPAIESVDFKIGGNYRLTSKIECLIIDCYETYEKIILKHPSSNSIVTIHMMKSTSKTENCSDIHLVHQVLPESEYYEEFIKFWDDAIKNLIDVVNKGYMIEDRDLTLGMYR